MSEKMIFTITTEIKNALELLKRIASKNKAGGAMPEGVLFKGDNLAAMNDLLTVSFKLLPSELGLTPQLFDEPEILPIKAINVILDSAEGTEITISEDKCTFRIKKSGKKATAKISGFSKEVVFPTIPPVEYEKIDEISVDSFIDAVNSTKHAISTNTAKMIYTGVHLIADGENLMMFAIDGYRAALWSTPYKSECDFRLSIPDKCLDVLMQALSKTSGKMSVVQTKVKNKAVFIVNGNRMVIRTRLLEGNVVEHSPMFADGQHRLIVNRKSLISVLKSITVIADDSATKDKMIISYGNDNITLKYSCATAEYEENVSAKGGNADEVKMGMNLRFLLDSLNAIKTENVSIDYKGSENPIRITAISDDDTATTVHQLCVPMRITDIQ